MKALILAGGLGTRLRSIAHDRPKPMVEVGGRPFLEYQIAQLGAQGFREVVLCVGHLADQIEDYFGDGCRWGVEIAYSLEEGLRGTAGAIRNSKRFIADTFLVLNGDTYLEADLRALVAAHRARRDADPATVGTLAAVAVPSAAAYGTLELDPEGRIVRFREKAQTGSGWINGGIYVLEPTILDFVPPDRAISIEHETFPLVLERGRRLFAHPVEGVFVDIGTPEGYRRFRDYIARRGDDHP